MIKSSYRMLTRIESGQSVLAAAAERDKNKASDDHGNNDHPVLAFEAKKGKVLDQKVQRPRAPHFLRKTQD
jgi:hypothetical protein